jgi:hypothetical protein
LIAKNTRRKPNVNAVSSRLAEDTIDDDNDGLVGYVRLGGFIQSPMGDAVGATTTDGVPVWWWYC